MDIFNRPPSISEDTLHYTLYPPAHLSEKTSATSLASCVQDHVESLLPGFLWHRDTFQLKVIPDPDKKDAWILDGTMRVGDSIDDEWCAVWLLREISAKWDLAISVIDSDGELLLIEAAEALPPWVKPTNSENRVWLYSSHLHIVPLEYVSPASTTRRHRRVYNDQDDDDDGNNFEDTDEYISTLDALKVLRDPGVNTLAPPHVEKLVWKKINRYPAAARSHTHTSKAYLPIDVAKALYVDPSLVQKAVETFYTRDAIQLRAAHRMARFPPEPSALRSVKMTRTAYAQLVGQKFHPPKIFGRWSESSEDHRFKDVGMKLACGFEMLYQESKSKVDAVNSSSAALASSVEAQKEALRRVPEYAKYLQNLVSAGYFRSEVEGSQSWKDLESKAAETFVSVNREDDLSRLSFAVLVARALAQAPAALSDTSQEAEDSDDWLNIDAENFDALLEKSAQITKPTRGTSGDEAKMDVDQESAADRVDDRFTEQQADRLQDLAQKVEQFVEGKGNLEGAQFEDEDSEEDLDADEDLLGDSDDTDDSYVERPDGDERRAAMDKLVAPINPSEYGKMPANYYTNSQRVARDVVGEDAETGEQDKRTGEEEKPAPIKIRPPILPRDTYDGADSDDETDSDEAEEDESEDDRPQIVGDIEIDMSEEEEEFLEFSRQALGISDQQWADIIGERKSRGAFVPAGTTPPRPPTLDDSRSDTRNEDPQNQTRRPGKNPNPNLDSFEAVMRAMDEELDRSRPKSKGKGKASKEEVPDHEVDIGEAMDAELKAMLERDGAEDDDDVSESMDYGLIKNFLESFKSQGGLSGPVSNLAGRLQPGWNLPRDES